MIVFDITTGEEFEIEDKSIEDMDRAQEEYQRKLNEDIIVERSKYIYNRDWIN